MEYGSSPFLKLKQEYYTMEIALILGGAFALWKLNVLEVFTPKDTEVSRRTRDEPMLIQAWRGFGKLLPDSGHPEQVDGLKNVSTDLQTLKENYVKANHTNDTLLTNQYMPTQQIKKNVFFKSTDDATHWPNVQFATGWYKAVADKTPGYYKRTTPSDSIYT